MVIRCEYAPPSTAVHCIQDRPLVAGQSGVVTAAASTGYGDRLPALVADLASEQAGVVCRRQLLALGFSDSAVRARLAARRWQRVHPGVFATFTGELPHLATVWAALLLAGPDAVVSHDSALRLFGMRSLPDEGPVHISVGHHQQIVSPPGVVVHRRCGLGSVVHPSRRPPSVRVEDAVLHVAAGRGSAAGGQDRVAVIADACQQRLTSPARLRVALGDLSALPGRRTIAAVLDDVASGAHSYLELRYLRGVERAHKLPPMHRQAAARLGGRRVWRDGWYPEFGVVHELDGRLGHQWSIDRRRDRLRDLTAGGEGLITLRHRYAEVVDAPCLTAHLVARVLRVRGWAGTPSRCGRFCVLPELEQSSKGWVRSSSL